MTLRLRSKSRSCNVLNVRSTWIYLTRLGPIISKVLFSYIGHPSLWHHQHIIATLLSLEFEHLQTL
jgi:hypothetical protein